MCVHTLRVYVCVKFFKVLQCYWKLVAWFLLSSQAVRVRVPKAKDLSMKLLKLPWATAPAAADVSQLLVPKVGSMKNNCHTHQRTLYTHTHTHLKEFFSLSKTEINFFSDFFLASYGFFHSAGQTINPGSPVTKIRGDNIDVDNATMRLRSICHLCLSLSAFLSLVSTQPHPFPAHSETKTQKLPMGTCTFLSYSRYTALNGAQWQRGTGAE